ncbi:MAG: PqqD family peptide modification chaperone [Smithellaceae bacterium]|nr:PqqD family peptide modification chaperone [Smithellaceae bacterium]
MIDRGILFVRPFDAELVIRLEGTARRIWELLEYPIDLPEIADKLAVEFSGTADKIRADVEEFVELLLGKGIVAVCDTPTVAEQQRTRYLYLLKRALLNMIYPEHELRISHLRRFRTVADQSKDDWREETRFLRDIRYRHPDAYGALADAKQDCISGVTAQIPFCFPHTMLGLSGLDNLERCAEQVFAEEIPGDFLEAGVCQGGAAIFLRALQVAFGQEDRRVWVADSFQGLPAPQTKVDRASGIDFSESNMPGVAFSLQGVRDNFLRYNLLDEGVLFLPGWFEETLRRAAIGPLAILRLDADLYSSTQEVLECLYDKVLPGGFVIIDDYGIYPFCRQAVDEFRQERSIRAPLTYADRTVVYWRKEDE